MGWGWLAGLANPTMLLANGAAIAGEGINAWSQQQTNESNREMARENREWMGNMSNSAHQREVADLKAAGLNPILSAGGSGAGTPTPNTPVNQAPQWGEALTKGVSTAMELTALNKELDHKDSQIAGQAAASNAANASAVNSLATAKATAAQMPAIEAANIGAKEAGEARKAHAIINRDWAKVDAAIERVGNTIGTVSNAVRGAVQVQENRRRGRDAVLREDRALRNSGSRGIPVRNRPN